MGMLMSSNFLLNFETVSLYVYMFKTFAIRFLKSRELEAYFDLNLKLPSTNTTILKLRLSINFCIVK